MSLTTSLEGAQANFYQLLNDLDGGVIDKVIIMDGEAEVAQLVTWAIYQAADPGGSAGVENDVVASYSGSPAVNTAPLYKLTKKMRDRQAGADAQKAVGSITTVLKASLIDGQLVTMIDAAGVSKNFEFDLPPDGVTPGNVAVDVSGIASADDVAIALQTAINGAGFGITATVAGNVVTVRQTDPGVAGNTAITDTVVDGGFVCTGFAGGTDAVSAAGVIGLKNSKNDASPRAALVPADHAAAIGL